MLRIGLTGGIGAGKSTAASRFAELGAQVIDHDVLARRAVEPGSAALVDIVHEFGDRIVVDGKLDREALAQIVFHDLRARDKLGAIVHPYVYAMGAAADKQARLQGVDVVVHDIPLLVETGQGHDFHLVVTVAADEDLRLKRLMEGRGMRHDEALARISAQATDDERADVADVVLDGNGTVEHLQAQVDECWRNHVPQ
ncbi:MAG: dephospho-CoA kinase [Actinobacteria bacterium HGW-Actinobacteria-4]|nr:MAG: dephospho-CoA kinase [Actinobacteria bacterium HGW-Actinobacteria-4]